ncbi:MAG: hypothetical protein H6906_06050 [Hyphomicrobiales bacterium]|nr:hypothetical protein [Hyphomicrobiales bacterium]
MTAGHAREGWWCRRGRLLPALLLAWVLALLPAGAPAADDPFVIFKPLAPPAGLDDTRAQAIRDRWTTALGPAHAEFAKTYAEYEINPNPATALAALKHFKAMSKNDVLRNRAFKTHRDMFLTLDALKFELVLQTTRKINEVRRRIGKPMIAVSYRVGSSGKRFREWLEWAAAGKDLAHMPIDEAYLLSKLSQSDDDISNTASPDDIAKDPLINERINGPRAAGVLAQVSAEMSGGAVTVTADDLKVEFLSPTKAYPHLMVRKAGEWRPELERWPDYLPAWIAGEREKYRGKFAEEQLHAWGMKAGHATDMSKLGDAIDAGSVTAATSDYKDSPMVAMFESRLFPQGITDPAGWMANNYRQIFLVHAGNVNDRAKYTLRMMEWWDRVGIHSAEDLRANGINVTDAQFASLRALADGIRNPDSEAALSALIGTDAKKNAALADLKKINMDLLRAGHRRHAGDLAQHLTVLMREYGEGRPASPGEQPRPPPTIDDLLAGNADFRNSMETLSTAYSNLPEELVARLNMDLAEYIKANEKSEDPKVVFDVEVRLLLMKSLERAEAAGSRLRRQGAAFESIAKLVGELREEVNQHLDVIAKGSDLDGFVDNLIAGETTRWRLYLDWDEGGRVPRVRWVEAQWDPVDVDTDLHRIKGFAQHFGWEHKSYAETLYDYFHGDGSGTWTGLAINAVRDMADMWDPSRMKERVVRMKNQDGETKVFVVKPTGGDAAVNLGSPRSRRR